MKMQYISPLILDASGNITLTASQAARLGIADDVASNWNDYAKDLDPSMLKEGFDINNPETWPDGFDINDDETYWLALIWDEEP